jgi:hypothetical protein
MATRRYVHTNTHLIDNSDPIAIQWLADLFDMFCANSLHDPSHSPLAAPPRSDEKPEPLLHLLRIPHRRPFERRRGLNVVPVLVKRALALCETLVGGDEDAAEPEIELGVSGTARIRLGLTMMVRANIAVHTPYELRYDLELVEIATLRLTGQSSSARRTAHFSVGNGETVAHRHSHCQ